MNWLLKFVDKKFPWLVASLTAILFFYLLPLITGASEDIRMIGTFNVDERFYVGLLSNAFAERTFDAGADCYGHLYYNLGLSLLFIIDLFIPVDSQVIAITLRLISFAFFAGTLAVIYKMSQYFFSNATAKITAILTLAGSACLLKYAVMVHPDVAQLFFTVLSVYWLGVYVKKGTLSYVLLSGIAAGLAFSSKYAGLLLLPVIFTALFANIKNNPLKVPFWLKSGFLILFTCFITGLSFSSRIQALISETKLPLHQLINYSTVPKFFLLAFICALVVYSIIYYKKHAIKKVTLAVDACTVSALVVCLFFAVFAITSPASLKDYRFISGFNDVTEMASTGHWFSNSEYLMDWIRKITSIQGLSTMLLALFGFNIYFLFKEKKEVWNHPATFSLIWTLFFTLVMLLRIKAVFLHYMLPVFPFIWMHAANSIEMLYKKNTSISIRWKKLAFPVILMLFLMTRSIYGIVEYRTERTNLFKNSAIIQAGKWLEASKGGEKIKIIADKYSYIPLHSNFNVFFMWGLNHEHLDNFDPDVIVINKKIYDRFLDTSAANSYAWGKDAYLEQNRIYRSLLENNNGQFELIKDFGEAKIFERKE